MNANLLRTPGTASWTGCALQRAQPAFRQHVSTADSNSSRSLGPEEKYSGNGVVSRTPRHLHRSCQAAAVAAWTCTPLSWLRSQFSKEVWVRPLLGLLASMRCERADFLSDPSPHVQLCRELCDLVNQNGGLRGLCVERLGIYRF